MATGDERDAMARLVTALRGAADDLDVGVASYALGDWTGRAIEAAKALEVGARRLGPVVQAKAGRLGDLLGPAF